MASEPEIEPETQVEPTEEIPTGGSPEPLPAEPEVGFESEPAWKRLVEQIDWYDGKAGWNQTRFKTIKVGQIALAAFIPVLAATSVEPWVLGAMGALVVVLEALQQLFAYQENWISYRATCEALKHERFLFESDAGPYAEVQRPYALLAERVESLVSREHAKWVASREEAAAQDRRRNG